MNKTEARFFSILQDRFPGYKIQPFFRLRITAWDAPELVHYTADFAVWIPRDSGWTARLFEVKARGRAYHSDELIRPKLACTENPWVDEIWLATWDKGTFTEKLIASNSTP